MVTSSIDTARPRCPHLRFSAHAVLPLVSLHPQLCIALAVLLALTSVRASNTDSTDSTEDVEPPYHYEQPDASSGRSSWLKTAINTPGYPFSPHDPPKDGKDPFFDGWYTRISREDGSSLAVVLGKYWQGKQVGRH